jgi:hypothetical protein
VEKSGAFAAYTPLCALISEIRNDKAGLLQVRLSTTSKWLSARCVLDSKAQSFSFTSLSATGAPDGPPVVLPLAGLTGVRSSLDIEDKYCRGFQFSATFDGMSAP